MKGDVFGYSPDIGKFVTRDGKTYSEYGHVYAEGPDRVFRSLPRPFGSHENYADWTDEQRAARLAKNDREREEHEKRRKSERDARQALVDRAKEKLTEEEFNAVLRYATDNE